MTNRQIDNRVNKINELEKEIKALQDKQNALKDELKTELESRSVNELQTGKFIIRWKTVISNRLDSKKLKADFPDIYKAFCRAQETKRFTIA